MQNMFLKKYILFIQDDVLIYIQKKKLFYDNLINIFCCLLIIIHLSSFTFDRYHLGQTSSVA